MKHIKKKIQVSTYYRKTKEGKRVKVKAHKTIIPKLYGLSKKPLDKQGKHHQKRRWSPFTKNTLIAGLITAIIYEMVALSSCLYGLKWAKQAIFIPWCFQAESICTALLFGPISNFIAFFLLGASAMLM